MRIIQLQKKTMQMAGVFLIKPPQNRARTETKKCMVFTRTMNEKPGVAVKIK